MAGNLTGRLSHGIADGMMALFAVKGSFYSTGAAANVTLDNTYPVVFKYDPTGGHRDITLDPVATSSGMWRVIVNAADNAENLVLKNVGGDTIATVNQNEAGIVYCDGSTWALVVVLSIALS